jgi:hypothetical protein
MTGVNSSLAPAITHLAAAHPALAQLAEVDENKVTPGLLGFVVFAALGAAVWFLMKNMNKQFKKVDFEVAPDPAEESAAGAEKAAAGVAATRGSGSGGPAGAGE